MQAPLLSGRGHLLAVPTTALPLFSLLFSGYQALDTLTLAIIQEYGETKQSPRQKVATDCGAVMLLPLRVCLKDRALFLLKIMLIYWPTSMSSQPWLSGHLPVPQGWPLNGGSAVLTFYLFHKFTVSIPWLTFPVALPFTLPYFFPIFLKKGSVQDLGVTNSLCMDMQWIQLWLNTVIVSLACREFSRPART